MRSVVLLKGLIAWPLLSLHGLSVFPMVPLRKYSVVARFNVIVVLSLNGVLGLVDLRLVVASLQGKCVWPCHVLCPPLGSACVGECQFLRLPLVVSHPLFWFKVGLAFVGLNPTRD